MWIVRCLKDIFQHIWIHKHETRCVCLLRVAVHILTLYVCFRFLCIWWLRRVAAAAAAARVLRHLLADMCLRVSVYAVYAAFGCLCVWCTFHTQQNTYSMLILCVILFTTNCTQTHTHTTILVFWRSNYDDTATYTCMCKTITTMSVSLSLCTTTVKQLQTMKQNKSKKKHQEKQTKPVEEPKMNDVYFVCLKHFSRRLIFLSSFLERWHVYATTMIHFIMKKKRLFRLLFSLVFLSGIWLVIGIFLSRIVTSSGCKLFSSAHTNYNK